MRVTISPLIVLIAFVSSDLAGSDLKSEEVYSAWLQMYDLKFQDAHVVLERWQKSHPDDSLGPASDAAAYLFSELTRLGVLESELFTDDARYQTRAKLRPDPQMKPRFDREIERTDQLADAALQASAIDTNALFAKSLTFGLRA